MTMDTNKTSHVRPSLLDQESCPHCFAPPVDRTLTHMQADCSNEALLLE